MKEAAGEANLTVIAILLIGIVLAIATPLISTMMENMAERACCQAAGNVWQSGGCYEVDINGNIGGQLDSGDYFESDDRSCKTG